MLIIKIKMYRFLLLLYIIQCCFSKILFCSYKSDFLRFNNMIIRETISSQEINSYFAIDIQKDKLDISTDSTSECSLLNEFPLTKYQFKDTLIQNNSVTISKYNYTSKKDHLFNIVGIFKSSPLLIKQLPQEKEQTSRYRPLMINFIYDDNIILSYELTPDNNTISFYEQIFSTPGYHSFAIEVASQDIWCLCPSKGNGFENNKYIFAWTDINPLLDYKQQYTYLTKIDDNKYSVLI